MRRHGSMRRGFHGWPCDFLVVLLPEKDRLHRTIAVTVLLSLEFLWWLHASCDDVAGLKALSVMGLLPASEAAASGACRNSSEQRNFFNGRWLHTLTSLVIFPLFCV